MPKKPLPIVWFVDNAELPENELVRGDKINKIAKAVQEFEEQNFTLKWLREEIKKILKE